MFIDTDMASDSRMSSPLTGLPWFDDIIWINAARLMSYLASLNRASPFIEIVHFHIISTPNEQATDHGSRLTCSPSQPV